MRPRAARASAERLLRAERGQSFLLTSGYSTTFRVTRAGPLSTLSLTTHACLALSLFSLPTPHPFSVRLVVRDRVSCQLRGVADLQLHPLNLSRLRPSGLVPPSRQQNGLESDSGAVYHDQALWTRKCYCERRCRAEDVSRTDGENHRVQFGSNPSTGKSAYSLALSTAKCG